LRTGLAEMSTDWEVESEPEPRKSSTESVEGLCPVASMAERVGFEPTRAFTLPVFKTGAVNRLATSPRRRENSATFRRSCGPS
jgi:hypothetical protein